MLYCSKTATRTEGKTSQPAPLYVLEPRQANGRSIGRAIIKICRTHLKTRILTKLYTCWNIWKIPSSPPCTKPPKPWRIVWPVTALFTPLAAATAALALKRRPAVDAVLDPGLMFQLGAHPGTALERLEGYSPIIFDRHDLRKGDVLFVFSNSGRNPAGVDAVLYAKKKGVLTIAVTAAKAHAQSKSRHSSGLLLKDAADIVLDNGASKNETCLTLGDLELAPISTIGASAVLHSVLFEAAQILAAKGVPPPVYKSSNAAGNDEYNTALAEKYKKRIKHLD